VATALIAEIVNYRVQSLKSVVKISVLLAVASLASCGFIGEGLTKSSKNVDVPKGPPIEDIVTPFDEALICLKGLVPPQLAFSVGTISDNTGKEQYADSGSGKIVTQGAADIVQSALFMAGVKVVNRRDAAIAITETNWGIRNIKQQIPAAFFLTGSINSLDFIPGGGAQVEVVGVGPRFRENRILVGLDLSLTDTATGEVVSNVPMQKQIFSKEFGTNIGRFFGSSLVSIDAGAMQREALNYTLRQMLNYATFQLLGQVVSEKGYLICSSKISAVDGTANSSGISRSNRSVLALAVARDISPTPPQETSAPAAGPAAVPAPPNPIPEAAIRRGQQATSLAAQAIAKAVSVQNITELPQSTAMRDEAVQLLTGAIAALREAATMGLSGAEGDAVALVVEQAIVAVQTAQAYVQTLEKVAAGTTAPTNSPVLDGGPTTTPPKAVVSPGSDKKNSVLP
jgi:curli biogenesis system outer membrane secretion channel CsgG